MKLHAIYNDKLTLETVKVVDDDAEFIFKVSGDEARLREIRPADGRASVFGNVIDKAIYRVKELPTVSESRLERGDEL